MNEISFRKWLSKQGVSLKVQSDLIARIKRVERSLGNFDIDDQFKQDGCVHLLSLFNNKGLNKNMEKIEDVDLPIGKYSLSTYKHAVVKYVHYITDIS